MAEDGLLVVSSDTGHVSQMATNSQGRPSEVTIENLILHDGSGETITVQAGDTPSGSHADTTLHNLLTALPGSRLLSTNQGEAIQIVSLSAGSDLSSISQGIDAKSWQLQVLPHIGSDLHQAVITVSDQGQIINGDHNDEHDAPDSFETIVTSQGGPLLMPPPPPPQHPLPPGCPLWAARLKDCEAIGDSYRGWVASEGELDALLSSHKQQTQSFWGTRQSPSPAKPSTRLMWKSQYVPFDGIPFVNAGSRAVVMECQYGPRRKGAQIKRTGDQILKAEFRQTCPARIYVKKVRKFPDYQIDMSQEKKAMKLAMDKAFQELKQQIHMENVGMERYYVQLPTEKAHEFHSDGLLPEECDISSSLRLHPKVLQKIRDMVAAGETRVYAVRKQLRRFVEKDLYDGQDSCAEKHNLTLFPTVNDLQNHIHQALKDIEAGLLQVTAPTVNVEVITSDNHTPLCLEDLQSMEQTSWQTAATQGPHAETVTVTLTQNPSDDGGHVISRVETHLSDGTTQVSSSLTPETAQLLAKLHPNMFPQGNLLLPVASQSTSNSQDGITLQSQNLDESKTNLTFQNATTTSDSLHLVEADNSEAGALHVVKSALETNPGEMQNVHLVTAAAQCAQPAAIHLVQQVTDGATLQLVQAAPVQLVQAANSETLQVVPVNQVIQNVHPIMSSEALQAQPSGEQSADSGEPLIKHEDAVSDNLVSMDMDHESDSLVLHEESQFDDGVED